MAVDQKIRGEGSGRGCVLGCLFRSGSNSPGVWWLLDDFEGYYYIMSLNVIADRGTVTQRGVVVVLAEGQE